MNLKQYIKTLSTPERLDFATRCQTTLGHLRNIAYGDRSCRERLAADIERESHGAVTRQQLFPDDWWRIWPELAPANRQEPRP